MFVVENRAENINYSVKKRFKLRFFHKMCDLFVSSINFKWKRGLIKVKGNYVWIYVVVWFGIVIDYTFITFPTKFGHKYCQVKHENFEREKAVTLMKLSLVMLHKTSAVWYRNFNKFYAKQTLSTKYFISMDYLKVG